MANPYLPPSAPIDTLPADVKCPQCGQASSSKVTFSWWGGLLGPKLFHVVRCNSCRKQYNGRTGASLTGVIVGYQLVVLAIVGALFGAFIALR